MKTIFWTKSIMCIHTFIIYVLLRTFNDLSFFYVFRLIMITWKNLVSDIINQQNHEENKAKKVHFKQKNHFSKSTYICKIMVHIMICNSCVSLFQMTHITVV